MRLTKQQIEIIRDTAREVFGPMAHVSLFGSRTDDRARGGDIDLLVESDHAIPDKLQKSLRMTALLQMRLGDQPIDILVIDPDTPLRPIHRQARMTGIQL